MSDAFWIWSHKESVLKKEVCFFRKKFVLDQIPEHCEVSLSADSIYRFSVNGTVVSRGPQKSDRYRRYYETVDIAPYLHEGENILAAMACHFIADEENSRIFETGPISVLCSLRGGFLLMCDTLPISTDRSWLVLESSSVRFVSPYLSRYATDMLDISLGEYPTGYESLDFDDSEFQRAVIVTNTTLEKDAGISLWPLTPANIPPMSETAVYPKRILRSNLSNAEDLLTKGSLTIPPGEAVYFEIDMGMLTTAHIELDIVYESDKHLPIDLTYAESYYKRREDGELYKDVRDDTENSIFAGEHDHLETFVKFGQHGPLKFETVFFRTFRFLRFDVGESTQPVTIKNLKIKEVLYPLQIEAGYHSDETENKIWDISVRTLRLCMHSTYEDCPYYEQMQYTMDTALQMKYTYQLSTDDRLARNAVDAFSASRMPDGLVTCNYPSKFTQVIPGFSLYFIEMLYDHYWTFGDRRFIRKYLHVADSILQYFIQKIEPDGLLPRSRYWEFVDWVPEWHRFFGVPLSKEERVNTIYHEMLVYFLKKAAWLNEALGFSGVGNEYREIAEKVAAAVRTHCFHKEIGLYVDTPGRLDASTHAQFWAVLSGIAEGDEAKRLMHEVLENKNLFQSSYSMNFYLFRALEMTGMYEKTAGYLKRWESMMDKHMTTWCEEPRLQRSDCHGWSSLPIFEYTNMLLGIKPAAPGYEAITIAPFTQNHTEMEGSIPTVKGPISVHWKKSGGNISLEASCPEGIPVEIILEGKHWKGQGKNISLNAPILLEKG